MPRPLPTRQSPQSLQWKMDFSASEKRWPAALGTQQVNGGEQNERTYVAIILGQLLATNFTAAVLCTRLHREAVHAHHVFDRIPVDLVTLVCVVTEAACVKTPTAWRLNLRLSRVVSAAKNAFCLVVIGYSEFVGILVFFSCFNLSHSRSAW